MSLPGSFGAVGMGTTPSDNPLLSSFQFKVGAPCFPLRCARSPPGPPLSYATDRLQPKVATHSDDRFNYVVPNGKRVEYYHQVEVDVQVGMEKDFSEVLRITSLEEDGEEDGIIAPPSCTAGPSLADLGDLFRTPPLRGGGERPPLPGLPRVPTPPHTGEVHVAQGFTVSQDVFQSAPNRLQSTPLKPPLSPSSLEGQQQKTPGLLSSASSLAGAVGKRAATMWGSAIDLVSMTQSPGGSSPRSSEDESTRPPHGRGLTRQGSQRNDSCVPARLTIKPTV